MLKHADSPFRSGAKAPVSVLLFHPADVFGGAERTSLNLIRLANPDQVRFVVVGDPRVLSSERAARFISLDELGISNGFVGFRKAFADARILLRLAKRENCSIVFGMLHYGALVAALTRVISFGRVSAVSSPRTPSVLGIEFHVGREGWPAFRWRVLVNLFCRLANRLIVASEGLKQECAAVFGGKPECIVVIPNGVDPETLGRAAAALPVTEEKSAFRIITSGRLAPEKDLGTLLAAFSRVREAVNAELWIMGDGPEFQQLALLAARLGISEYTRFLGFQQNPFSYLKCCDVFVHTSRFEGFGNVLLEAMACDISIIATDCDFGPREIIQSGENGMLVPPFDPDALAQAILSLLADENLRQRLADGGRRRLQQYDLGEMVRRYEQVILSM